MAATVRCLARLVFLAAALLSGALPPSPPRVQAVDEGTMLAGSLPQVRMRKLHLVRPDLILYPIAHEVYC